MLLRAPRAAGRLVGTRMIRHEAWRQTTLHAAQTPRTILQQPAYALGRSASTSAAAAAAAAAASASATAAAAAAQPALGRSASTSAAAAAAAAAASASATAAAAAARPAAWLRQMRGVTVERNVSRSYRVHPALNALGNASYLALASGFLMTDLLALRALLASGYLGLVCFHSLQKKPLWVR